MLALGLAFLLLSQAVFAQGLGEYGRLLGGIGPKKGAISGRGPAENPKVPTPGVGDPEGNPMPSALTVESESAVLYARSEEWADAMMQLSRGEKLIPMVHAAGANTLWYMVKTQKGAIGWVKASDVSPVSIKE